MRQFVHVPGPEIANLKDEMTEQGRFYHTPEGNRYPSVTTVLAAGTDHKALDNWKKRVGEEEVRRVSGQAAIRGTAVHDLAEQYLSNNTNYKKGHMPINVASFYRIKPILDANIGTITGLELPLYSDFLRTAGRTDCIGTWNNILSIIDFKTSKRIKSRDDIENYFLQESCYAYMYFERTGIAVPQIVTVMTVDNEEPLVFVERTKDHIKKFIDIRKKVDL